MLKVLCALVIAFVAAVCLVLAKRAADRRLPSFADANDVGWTLMFFSAGLMSGQTATWNSRQFAVTIACDIALALLLSANLRRKTVLHAKLAEAGIDAPPVGVGEAIVEVSVGLAAILVAIR